MLLFSISFIAGVLTTLAPCILPLLPVIIGSSIEGGVVGRGRKRAYIVVASLGVSVVLFTLLLKASTALIAIPPSFWTYLSGGIVIAFGVTLLYPSLWEKLPFLSRINLGSNRVLTQGYQKNTVWGDMIIGAALGPVFSTCSPTYFIVLATVLPESPVTGLIYLFAYTAGLCLTLLLIGLLGQQVVDRLGFAADPRGIFKRSLGVLFVLVGLMIVTGGDKKLQIVLLEAGVFDITKVEQFLLRLTEENETSSVESEMSKQTVFDEAMRLAQKEQLYPRPPEIRGAAGYVNTGVNPDGTQKPITIGEFKGKKVVLIDIWTYSCINCQRTLPYLKAWDEKYRDKGLQIIGVHTPEFAFEKVLQNVETAVKNFGLEYPSVLDNDYATWRAFGNNYWPRKYLIDIDGFIVYDHIGEGAYEETEEAIKRALNERAEVLNAERVNGENVASAIPEVNTRGVASPEIYFGAWRNDLLANGTPREKGTRVFVAEGEPRLRNALYLEGEWKITEEYAESVRPASIIFKYSARDVYMVASAKSLVRITILRDGVPVGEFAGEDIDRETSVGTVGEHRLYKLIHDDTPGEHTIEIKVDGSGFEAYTFTFG